MAVRPSFILQCVQIKSGQTIVVRKLIFMCTQSSIFVRYLSLMAIAKLLHVESLNNKLSV